MQSHSVDRADHFEFGENWARFATLIDESRIQSAEESLVSLGLEVQGKRVLDIGSGSGLFSLAALRLGAKEVRAIDIDENSVKTTHEVLSSYRGPGKWAARRASVFDLSAAQDGKFSVVYSWGVLHHTGDMWRAMSIASRMVEKGGVFAFALYEKTPLCGIWRQEKALYSKAPAAVQLPIRIAFMAVYCLGVLLSGRNPFSKVRRRRGMNMSHDVHDWLGGFPYESTSATEVREHLAALGFSPVLERPVPVRLFGLLGSGCSEYVYRKSGS